jgi:hypothetical protein
MDSVIACRKNPVLNIENQLKATTKNGDPQPLRGVGSYGPEAAPRNPYTLTSCRPRCTLVVKASNNLIFRIYCVQNAIVQKKYKLIHRIDGAYELLIFI